MADVLINDLSAKGTCVDADQFEVDTGTVSNKMAASVIKTYVKSGLAISDVTNLQTSLDGKSSTSHTHLLAAGATDVTATATEVNVLDGYTGTTGDLNHISGIASNSGVDINGYRSVVTVSGTTKTFALSDANTFQSCTNGSAVSVTVPPNSSVAYAIGVEIEVWQDGAGVVTASPGSGVTINKQSGFNVATNGQYTGFCLKKLATDTWIAFGNLDAV